MCELFALSSKLPTQVSFSLKEFSRHGGETSANCDGWGLAFYDEKIAKIYKEPKAAAFSKQMQFIQSHHNKINCVISHVRKATVGKIALENTQPFVRELRNRSHVFAHNGNLKNIKDNVTFKGCDLEGDTDSEYAFCYLMASLKNLWEKSIPTLKERVLIIEEVFCELAAFGPANFLYSDGDYLYVFANKRTQTDGIIKPPGMFDLSRQCFYGNDSLKLAGVDISCNLQNVLLFASIPLTDEDWNPVPQCKVMVIKKGFLVEVK